MTRRAAARSARPRPAGHTHRPGPAPRGGERSHSRASHACASAGWGGRDAAPHAPPRSSRRPSGERHGAARSTATRAAGRSGARAPAPAPARPSRDATPGLSSAERSARPRSTATPLRRADRSASAHAASSPSPARAPHASAGAPRCSTCETGVRRATRSVFSRRDARSARQSPPPPPARRRRPRSPACRQTALPPGGRRTQPRGVAPGRSTAEGHRPHCALPRGTRVRRCCCEHRAHPAAAQRADATPQQARGSEQAHLTLPAAQQTHPPHLFQLGMQRSNAPAKRAATTTARSQTQRARKRAALSRGQPRLVEHPPCKRSNRSSTTGALFFF